MEAAGVRARSDSWPPPTRRVGSMRWRPYESNRAKDKAYSQQAKAMIKDAVRLAITTDCHVAIHFIPRSGRVRSFSTAGTANEFLQIFDGMVRYSRQMRARLSTSFVSIQARFAQGAPWLDDAVQRLERLGCCRATLMRFHATYLRVLPRYRSAHALMADVAGRLGLALRTFCDEAEAKLSEPDEIIDLTVDSSTTPSGVSAARVAPPMISSTPVAPTPVALPMMASRGPGYRGNTAAQRASAPHVLSVLSEQHLVNLSRMIQARASAPATTTTTPSVTSSSSITQ